MRLYAASILSFGITNCLAGVTTTAGIETPVLKSGTESAWIASTSSPKNSIRTPSVAYAGKTSTTSPRTRKVPGA